MDIANVPRFDHQTGVARAGTLRWIIIQATQFAKLRVALVNTGPGYIGSHWVDFDPKLHTAVIARGCRGDNGEVGPRGLAPFDGRDGGWHWRQYDISSGRLTAVPELVIPGSVVKNRQFEIIHRDYGKRAVQGQYSWSSNLVILEIPRVINLQGSAGYQVGVPLSAQVWDNLQKVVANVHDLAYVGFADNDSDVTASFRMGRVRIKCESENPQLIVVPRVRPPQFAMSWSTGSLKMAYKVRQ